jgi:flagellar basal body-associated protein FliL
MLVSEQVFMENESPFQTQPAYVQKASNKRRLVIIFLVVFLLIVAALGALYLLGSSAKHQSNPPTNPIPTAQTAASPTPASISAQLTVTPAATVSPSVALTSLTVSVLNGSGIPGAAGKVASALKSAGFSNVTTGNASVFTYTGITVYVKNSDNLSAVKQALASAEPNEQVTTSVKATIPTDVQVIIGK